MIRRDFVSDFETYFESDNVDEIIERFLQGEDFTKNKNNFKGE